MFDRHRFIYFEKCPVTASSDLDRLPEQMEKRVENLIIMLSSRHVNLSSCTIILTLDELQKLLEKIRREKIDLQTKNPFLEYSKLTPLISNIARYGSFCKILRLFNLKNTKLLELEGNPVKKDEYAKLKNEVGRKYLSLGQVYLNVDKKIKDPLLIPLRVRILNEYENIRDKYFTDKDQQINRTPEQLDAKVNFEIFIAELPRKRLITWMSLIKSKRIGEYYSKMAKSDKEIYKKTMEKVDKIKRLVPLITEGFPFLSSGFCMRFFEKVIQSKYNPKVLKTLVIGKLDFNDFLEFLVRELDLNRSPKELKNSQPNIYKSLVSTFNLSEVKHYTELLPGEVGREYFKLILAKDFVLLTRQLRTLLNKCKAVRDSF